MIYITGDKHRDFSSVKSFCKKQNTTTDDVMIVLGDAGINYFNDDRDKEYKSYLAEIPITFFCIHGNHDMRPWHVPGIKLIDYHGAKAYAEPDYPNIIYGIDGLVYDFNGKQCIVAGGAYRVDKYYRLANNMRWFYDEQPNDAIKTLIRESIASHPNIDVVLSHTCPFKYIPTEMFISGIDQSQVDNSTEHFLDEIEEIVPYKKWYCGHWHTEKVVQNLRFMFNDIIEFG